MTAHLPCTPKLPVVSSGVSSRIIRALVKASERIMSRASSPDSSSVVLAQDRDRFARESAYHYPSVES